MFSDHSVASQAVIGLVLSLTSIGVGYQIGQLFPSNLEGTGKAVGLEQPENEVEETEEVEDSEGIPDGDLTAVKAKFMEPCKMVLVVRMDLKLQPGNIASECCQATLSCFKALSRKNVSLVQHWERTGQAKIALKAKNETQIQELEAIAKSLNLCARSVKARGIEGISDGSITVLAIGPAPVNLVNEVTGKLRLL